MHLPCNSKAVSQISDAENQQQVESPNWLSDDLTFRSRNPVTYQIIAAKLNEKRSAREHYISTIIEFIKKEIKKTGLQTKVSGRPKHIYSIYRKMRFKRVPFEAISDLLGTRIIVPEKTDCYRIMGLIHAFWPHVPRSLDDYIAAPKVNGYSSLHTSVMCEDEKELEIQIRTPEMHQTAKCGSAAHLQYKNLFTKNAKALCYRLPLKF